VSVGALNAELQEMLGAMREAGADVLGRYAAFERIENAPGNITTDADRASQEIILTRLQHAFPGDRLIAEESTPTLKAAAERNLPANARAWIVDPIDGTRGFARKNGEFSIMIALVESGCVVLGAVHEPAIDRTTYAVRNAGCFSRSPWTAQPQRCRIRKTASIVDATLAMSRSRGASGEAKLLGIFGARQAVQTYSAGIKLAQVARGEADLYLGDYPTMSDWDLCAGCILVEEAGGRVTDFDGAPLRFALEPPRQSNGILATNGELHSTALAIVQGRPDGLY
jgi:3'(2'), 5'-bisphosphate nucleotidase